MVGSWLLFWGEILYELKQHDCKRREPCPFAHALVPVLANPIPSTFHWTSGRNNILLGPEDRLSFLDKISSFHHGMAQEEGTLPELMTLISLWPLRVQRESIFIITFYSVPLWWTSFSLLYCQIRAGIIVLSFSGGGGTDRGHSGCYYRDGRWTWRRTGTRKLNCHIVYAIASSSTDLPARETFGPLRVLFVYGPGQSYQEKREREERLLLSIVLMEWVSVFDK